MSDGLRLAAALAALFCGAGCVRLAVALAHVTRGRRTVASGSLLVLSGSIAGVAVAAAAALLLHANPLVAVVIVGAIAAGISAAFAVQYSFLGSLPILVVLSGSSPITDPRPLQKHA